jgi:hypothetical protein
MFLNALVGLVISGFELAIGTARRAGPVVKAGSIAFQQPVAFPFSQIVAGSTRLEKPAGWKQLYEAFHRPPRPRSRLDNSISAIAQA